MIDFTCLSFLMGRCRDAVALPLWGFVLISLAVSGCASDSENETQLLSQSKIESGGGQENWTGDAQSLLLRATQNSRGGAAARDRETEQYLAATHQRSAANSSQLQAMQTRINQLESSVNRVSLVEDDLKGLMAELTALNAMAPPEVPTSTQNLQEKAPKIYLPERVGANSFVPQSREEVLAEIQENMVIEQANSANATDSQTVFGDSRILGLGESSLIGLHLFSAASQEVLAQNWSRLSANNPDLFAGMTARVARISFGVREGVFYRLKAGPVETADQAIAICRALRTRGQGCVVSEFSGEPT